MILRALFLLFASSFLADCAIAGCLGHLGSIKVQNPVSYNPFAPQDLATKLFGWLSFHFLLRAALSQLVLGLELLIK